MTRRSTAVMGPLSESSSNPKELAEEFQAMHKEYFGAIVLNPINQISSYISSVSLLFGLV